MVTRRGTLLEKNVDKIFRLADFNTKRNVFINGYEVDVFAELEGVKIIIQCKQYESAKLSVRDALHQWDSKNKFILADKCILVIYGQDVNSGDRDIAKKLDIILWDEKDLDRIEILSSEKLLKELNLTDNKKYEKKNIKVSRVPLIVFIFSAILLCASFTQPLLTFISLPALVISGVLAFTKKN